MFDANFEKQFLGSDASFASMRGLSKFGDPFMLPSWSVAPNDIRSVFDLCRFLYSRNPEYAQAMTKLVSYFITDVEFYDTKAGDKREQAELREWLHEQVNAFEHQAALGMDWAAFGNAFGRLYRPFHRSLIIPTQNGYLEESLTQFEDVSYDYSSMRYIVRDPTTAHLPEKQRRKISVPFVDRVDRDMNRITLRRIDPSWVWLEYCDRSGRQRVVERFTPEFEASIKRGDLHNVNSTHISQLEAISKACDYIYNEGEVFHLKEEYVSGVSNGGFGVPMILRNLANLHQIQVYRRVDESLGLDYMMPMRVFFPQANLAGSGMDSMANAASGAVWRDALRMMLNDRHDKPFQMHALPFPTGYQEIGGNGKQFAPKDSIAWQLDSMLNATGVPAEMYRGSMSIQQMPGAMRMFENQWRFLKNKLGTAHLRWVTHSMQNFMGRELTSLKASEPRLIDEVETRHILLQLTAGGEFPRRLALRNLGITDPVAAATERAQEDVDIQKAVQKIQLDAALEANGSVGGQPGPGGAPSGVGTTPAQRAQDALQVAQELLQIPFDGDRAKRLRELQAQDPDMHALVKQKMEELRNASASQGRQQVAQLAGAM